MATDTTGAIRSAFRTMRLEAKMRHRDIAEQLGISEGELVAAHAGAAAAGLERLLRATRLRPEWPRIVAALKPLGDLMALTRNASCVHEKTGVYARASGDDAVGLVLGGPIDLRLFYRRWAHGYALDEATASGEPQRSLQFFDAAGMAIHKVFTRAGTDLAAWDALIARFAADEQQPGLAARPVDGAAAEAPDAQIDVDALRAAWAAMRDTHEFHDLLKAHGVTRTQALRLAEPRFAQRVDADAASLALNAAARDGVPIMVFVGNPGIIQIHSGPVRKIATMGPWLNVLDDGFNLHLREDHIAAAWIVGKPTQDGLVTSLELFDARGETIAMFFGERKPGKPELTSWRSLIEHVAKEAAPCAA
jgi:putative hemin transport protein